MNNKTNYLSNSPQTPPSGGWGAFLADQLAVWETARNNFEALKQIKTKTLDINGIQFNVQFNPARIVSSGAKVDAKSIQERKCFLCAENRPKEQMEVPFSPANIGCGAANPPFGACPSAGEGIGSKYSILVNPFPIFPKHFTIPDVEHVPQLIRSRIGDMLELARQMDNYVVFYNGPKCGASAPDHAHFQAGNKGFLPIERAWRNHITEQLQPNLFVINYVFPALAIETAEKSDAETLFERIYEVLPVKTDETEPMMNLLAWYESNKWIIIIILRSKHRPACYSAEGDENILISPASVDLGGVLITPLEKDFEKITAKNIEGILHEVCLNKIDFQKIIEHLKK